MKNKMKSKKLYFGCYAYKGLYISVYEGTISRVWNIFKDEDLIYEYAVGFDTKREALAYIDKNQSLII
jgi:hypothetical protein